MKIYCISNLKVRSGVDLIRPSFLDVDDPPSHRDETTPFAFQSKVMNSRFVGSKLRIFPAR